MPPSPVPAAAVRPSYQDYSCWLRYQEFFPSGLSFAGDAAPTEQWWSWRRERIHLDRIVRADAPAVVLALHGIGTYGRMLAPYGRLPSMTELDFLAPDLPGFGLSNTTRRAVRYGTWIECVVELIRRLRCTDSRPIILFGLGAGGRLAYDVAALAPGAIAGVIATSLLDPRDPGIRQRIAAHPVLGRKAHLFPARLLTGCAIPLRWLANVPAMSNTTRLAKAVWADPLGGGVRIPLGFVRSYLEHAPVVEPERCNGPPVLLAHPAEDRCTPLPPSRRFLDRIGGPTRFALLRGAGHIPVEESGLGDLDGAVRDFLDEIELRPR